MQRLGFETQHNQFIMNYNRATYLHTPLKPSFCIAAVNAQPLNVISLGAGKQSSYMLLQALEGKFEFKPDLAII